MRLGRRSEPRIGSTWATDTSSKLCYEKQASACSGYTSKHSGVLYCRIFEAGESDIGHTDGAAVNVVTAAGIDVAQHAVPIIAVRVAGLHSTASAQDVAMFLEGAELRRGLDSVVLLADQGTGSKAAIVELADETAQRLALSKSNQAFGGTCLQVFPLTASETAIFAQASAQGFSLQELQVPQQPVQQQQQQQSVARVQQIPPASFRTDGSTLKLRGLPYSASVTDILEFFQGATLPYVTTLLTAAAPAAATAGGPYAALLPPAHAMPLCAEFAMLVLTDPQFVICSI